MKLIVITTPQFFEGEAAAVTSFIPKRFGNTPSAQAGSFGRRDGVFPAAVADGIYAAHCHA